MYKPKFSPYQIILSILNYLLMQGELILIKMIWPTNSINQNSKCIKHDNHASCRIFILGWCMHKPFHQQQQAGGHSPFWGSRKTLLHSSSPVEIFFFKFRAFFFQNFTYKEEKKRSSRSHSLYLVYLKKMMILDLQYILFIFIFIRTG